MYFNKDRNELVSGPIENTSPVSNMALDFPCNPSTRKDVGFLRVTHNYFLDYLGEKTHGCYDTRDSKLGKKQLCKGPYGAVKCAQTYRVRISKPGSVTKVLVASIKINHLKQ